MNDMNELKEKGFAYENSTDYLIEQQRVICNGFEDRVNKMLTNNNLFISIDFDCESFNIVDTKNGELFKFHTNILPTCGSTNVVKMGSLVVDKEKFFTRKTYTAEDCLKPYDFTMFSKKFRDFAILFFGYTQKNERKIKAKDFKEFLIEEFEKKFKDSEYSSCKPYDFYNTLWFELCEKFKKFCV